MLTGVSVSNLATTDFLCQEFSQLQSSQVADTTSPLQYTGSWSCEVLLQVHCSDLLAEPASSESHPLNSQSTRTKINHPSAETSLFTVLLSSCFLCHTLPYPFRIPPVVALNIMGRKQKPWLEAVSSSHLPGRLPSKPTALSVAL